MMLCVWVHGCDPGRVPDGSLLALYQTLLIRVPFFYLVQACSLCLKIIGFKYKTSSSCHLIGFPYGIRVTSGQQYHVEEKSAVILYTLTYINRHAGTPEKQKQCK